MSDAPEKPLPRKARDRPMLSVRNGTGAIDFYKAALGADELFRVENASGEVRRAVVRGRSRILAGRRVSRARQLQPPDSWRRYRADDHDRGRSRRRFRAGWSPRERPSSRPSRTSTAGA